MRYGKSYACGLTWYCQSPGKSWKTDPIIGFELEWRQGSRREGTETGWFLYSDEHFGEYLGRSFKVAAFDAYQEYQTLPPRMEA